MSQSKITEYYNTDEVYTKVEVENRERDIIKQYATIHNKLNAKIDECNTELDDCNEYLKKTITPQKFNKGINISKRHGVWYDELSPTTKPPTPKPPNSSKPPTTKPPTPKPPNSSKPPTTNSSNQFTGFNLNKLVDSSGIDL